MDILPYGMVLRVGNRRVRLLSDVRVALRRIRVPLFVEFIHESYAERLAVDINLDILMSPQEVTSLVKDKAQQIITKAARIKTGVGEYSDPEDEIAVIAVGKKYPPSCGREDGLGGSMEGRNYCSIIHHLW